MMTKTHYYFMLNLSFWPLISSTSAFCLLFSFMLLSKYSDSISFVISILNVVLTSFMWWMFYSKEFNLEGLNSDSLESGLKFSMILFISSEVFFFFSFFWSYFHYYLAPCLEIGLAWPPFSVEMFDCMNVPLINTVILMSSGLTVTASHNYLIKGDLKKMSFSLLVTIILGLVFTWLQAMEYSSSFFGISDSSFGTCFFMLTGFHGIHVIIGTIFLMMTLKLSFSLSASKNSYTSFEMASWYWHFVDVVWIFLYFCLYYLNN